MLKCDTYAIFSHNFDIGLNRKPYVKVLPSVGHFIISLEVIPAMAVPLCGVDPFPQRLQIQSVRNLFEGFS